MPPSEAVAAAEAHLGSPAPGVGSCGKCLIFKVDGIMANHTGNYYTAVMALFGPLFLHLNQENVRYVVAGGLAVVLHGFARLTGDVDLIVDLQPHEARNAIRALSALGLRPRLPVKAMDFADAAIRAGWISDKGMRVFSLWDPQNPMRAIDLFAEHPIDFEGLWSRAEQMDIGSTFVRVASIEDLIQLKRMAGRPHDLADIEALEEIRKRREG